MRILPLLKCIGKALLKGAARAVGADIVGEMAVEVAQEVWTDWNKTQDEAERRAELQAVVQMAAGEFREQIEAVVREMAADQPETVQEQLSTCLQQLPELARASFRRPEDQKGQSVPRHFQLMQPKDLVPFVSFRVTRVPPRPRVTLAFSKGVHTGQDMVCTEPTVLVIGKAKDCNPRYPKQDHEQVSRHHCLVEINPPDVVIQDMGSLNGTFVNNDLLGKRPRGTAPQPGQSSPPRSLKNGDTVRLTPKNQVAFQVRIVIPAQCGACGTAIPDEQKAACIQVAGGYLCVRCRQQGQEPSLAVKPCAWCRREVKDERGANRPGLFVCGDCRGNMQAMMQEMLGQAQAGKQELRAIRDYTMMEELGHGGMGAVYLARKQSNNSSVAIKLMLPKVAADERAVEEFQREIRNTMVLNHQHVVRLLDHGYANGTFFMVLEYCDGGSICDLMAQRGGKLPVDEAVEITLQALEGLEYAHEVPIPFVKQKGGGYGPGKGLVHRDVKPANLFVTGWGSSRIVKLGDYGLAKAFDESGLSGGTRTGDVMGTWEFMCRQQVADCKRAKAEVDVWGMAASLYNMLTGQLPRDFPDGMDPWWVILETPAVPILSRNPHIPPQLAKVIDAALVEEPQITFQSAAAFRAALEEAL